MQEHVAASSTDALTEDTPCLKKMNVNKRLLPIKLHYFLFYGATGCVVPYMPVVGKELGISATAVGLIFTITPFVVLFSKPGFGAITDHFRNFRLIMYILVFVTTACFFSITLIPPISNQNHTKDITLQCLTESVVFRLPPDFNESCVRNIIYNGTECDLKFLHYIDNRTDTESDRLGDFLEIQFDQQTSPTTANDHSITVMIVNNTAHGNSYISSVIKIHMSLTNRADIEFDRNSTFAKICNKTMAVYAINCKPSLDSCSSKKSDDEDLKKIYGSYQFWLFTILAVISGTGSATMYCLSDAACMEVLGDDTELYGKQRLWATISWGLGTLLTGYLNDLASTTYSQTTYTPGFYLMIGLVVLDFFVLYRIAPEKTTFSSNICKDVGRIFVSCEMVCFAVAVTIMGSLTALLWSYQFWYLQDLGANQLLLGLTVAVQCLVAEVPFFFLSGYIIKTLGHFYCLVGCFAAFCLRYVLYFFLKDPWYTLPIEILHGQTFATFYATMTSYAKTRAPAGTEATTIGVMGGLFEGLGLAIGNILSGIGYDNLTGRYTFLTAAVISGISTVIFIIVRLTIAKKSS